MRADRPDEMMKLGAFFHPTGNHVAAWLHPEAQIESHEILEVAGAEAVATAEGNMEEEGFEPSVPLVSRGADPAGPSRRARGRRSLRDRLRGNQANTRSPVPSGDQGAGRRGANRGCRPSPNRAAPSTTEQESLQHLVGRPTTISIFAA
jgi:hypothetical protein